jgi:tRNA uridine 5-carboxymethylaminomethyl modification enzyme
MFTSRAEYRLLLREDNADLRLTEIGRELGLVNDTRWQLFSEKREAIVKLQANLTRNWIRAATPSALQAEVLWGKKLTKEVSLIGLLSRPEVDIKNLLSFLTTDKVNQQVAEQVEVQAKYAGYIERQQTEINRALRYDNYPLATNFDYTQVSGLSNEVCEKLQRHQPETLGHASRIPGLTPAAISLLLIFLKKQHG